ncbi:MULTISPECIES: response regulator [unclassified Arthrobacter]|uniref:response regulator n=1 Tax=unclassified Arthrobacter TaxID=235627 RepID=UPI0014915B49|nr:MULTISPECIES: response regulator transcription factor [unclassified Arthrobacter]MBE0011119.1 DNA-binding response regulator [Arthrobacter sp. AET 35A]NOJ59663.1 response regulator transcription factor [Arthrobacter sp. 260]NOJ63255.1 response regulator transcription factor [Arthrobacter sp. 147(2020)]
MDSIRVLLADDQALVRAGFATMLSIEDDIEVVGQVTNGQEAVDFASQHDVDVILMDVQMPVMDGIQATELITRAHRGRVIILTTFEREDYLFDAIRGGASGFLLKNADPDDLIAAVQAVAGGYALLAPEVTVRVIERFAKSLEAAGTTPAAQPSSEHRKRLDSLTQREKEILASLATGLSNAELASKFFLAEATVKSHVSSLLAKVQVRDRVQAVVFAYESGLIRPGE